MYQHQTHLRKPRMLKSGRQKKYSFVMLLHMIALMSPAFATENDPEESGEAPGTYIQSLALEEKQDAASAAIDNPRPLTLRLFLKLPYDTIEHMASYLGSGNAFFLATLRKLSKGFYTEEEWINRLYAERYSYHRPPQPGTLTLPIYRTLMLISDGLMTPTLMPPIPHLEFIRDRLMEDSRFAIGGFMVDAMLNGLGAFEKYWPPRADIPEDIQKFINNALDRGTFGCDAISCEERFQVLREIVSAGNSLAHQDALQKVVYELGIKFPPGPPLTEEEMEAYEGNKSEVAKREEVERFDQLKQIARSGHRRAMYDVIDILQKGLMGQGIRPEAERFEDIRALSHFEDPENPTALQTVVDILVKGEMGQHRRPEEERIEELKHIAFSGRSWSHYEALREIYGNICIGSWHADVSEPDRRKELLQLVCQATSHFTEHLGKPDIEKNRFLNVANDFLWSLYENKWGSEGQFTDDRPGEKKLKDVQLLATAGCKEAQKCLQFPDIDLLVLGQTGVSPQERFDQLKHRALVEKNLRAQELLMDVVYNDLSELGRLPLTDDEKFELFQALTHLGQSAPKDAHRQEEFDKLQQSVVGSVAGGFGILAPRTLSKTERMHALRKIIGENMYGQGAQNVALENIINSLTRSDYQHDWPDIPGPQERFAELKHLASLGDTSLHVRAQEAVINALLENERASEGFFSKLSLGQTSRSPEERFNEIRGFARATDTPNKKAAALKYLLRILADGSLGQSTRPMAERIVEIKHIARDNPLLREEAVKAHISVLGIRSEHPSHLFLSQEESLSMRRVFASGGQFSWGIVYIDKIIKQLISEERKRPESLRREAKDLMKERNPNRIDEDPFHNVWFREHFRPQRAPKPLPSLEDIRQKIVEARRLEQEFDKAEEMAPLMHHLLMALVNHLSEGKNMDVLCYAH